jgi:plasmid stabilization system protein ParE
MSAFRISPEAEAEIDDIWLYLARESGSIEIATRRLEGITDRFWRLAESPYPGAQPR